MKAERVFHDGGVSIPLSTVIKGGETGVLSHLRAGLGQAERDLEEADDTLASCKEALEQAELAFARAEATAIAWRTAHDAAKAAFA